MLREPGAKAPSNPTRPAVDVTSNIPGARRTCAHRAGRSPLPAAPRRAAVGRTRAQLFQAPGQSVVLAAVIWFVVLELGLHLVCVPGIVIHQARQQRPLAVTMASMTARRLPGRAGDGVRVRILPWVLRCDCASSAR